MKTVYILRGLPASGKSTWARRKVDERPNSVKRINKDDLRAMLDNSRWSPGAETFVLRTRDGLIREALHEGFHVIVDDTNLHPKHVERIREIVDEFKKNSGQDVRIEIVNFTDVPLEECIRRDRVRKDSVGEKVIRDMYIRYLAEPFDVPSKAA